MRYKASGLFSVPMCVIFTKKPFFHLKVGQQKCPEDFVDRGVPYGHKAENTKSLISGLKIIFWHQKLVGVSFGGVTKPKVSQFWNISKIWMVL